MVNGTDLVHMMLRVIGSTHKQKGETFYCYGQTGTHSTDCIPGRNLGSNSQHKFIQGWIIGIKVAYHWVGSFLLRRYIF